MEEKKKRIEIIDALRGLSVTLMVIHHAFYDFVVFLDAPRWIYTNPVFDVLQAIFIGVFICVSGVSSRFSKGNVERGAIVIVIAVIITYVTVRMEMPIYFGILHLLGFLMIFYGLTQKLWNKIPRKTAPFIYITLVIASVLARIHLSPESDNLVIRDLLSVFGWHQQGFVSFDYQVILPWIFVFLFGTWAGGYIREGKFPSWFYEMKVPFFPLVGRHALVIYVLHQPVLYGLTMGLVYLM
ncbi:MAG: DUF1624 domain-containing protein [Oscillospiraceae bacterium]|nr:DUF1624 domain-containing protein [Oscillospiraceae bacterium]